MRTMDEDPAFCFPGQRLCLSGKSIVNGVGTYERNGYIYSMLVGTLKVTERDEVISKSRN